MRTASAAAALALGVAIPASAAADDPRVAYPQPPSSPAAAGSFDGLGPDHRVWEVTSETSLTADAGRIATEELSLARLFCLLPTVGLVTRVSFGVDADLSPNGANSIQGPQPSVGLRWTSEGAEDSWVEVGIRMIVPYPALRPNDPSGLLLALEATFSSQTADDARWLAFGRMGYQLYGNLQSRFEPVADDANRVALGVRYGVITSLVPLQIQTWLGPASGVVGDTFVDLFADFTRLHGFPVNLEVGARGEASLSSIWPSDAALPLGAEAYVGWSPAPWLILRAFGGIATAPLNSSKLYVPYGLRAIAYFDEGGNLSGNGP